QEPGSQKVLLVGSRACARVEELLVRSGWRVVKVNGGARAVGRAKHEALRAAVLISTGPEMDLTETALNLRDIQPSLEIIIVADGAVEEADRTDTVAHAIPKTRVLTSRELNDYLASPKWAGSRGRP
ncbi:MAG TPA: hypothetical protein VMO00_03895, partial [Methylomirabilota bacterium]|nr:hypothetical protein [Methylomirabilota bacterium]